MAVPGPAGYFSRVTSARHPRDLRASDADRERVAAVLAEAMGDGRLTPDEHAERMHRAYAARTLGELAALTGDLLAPAAQPFRLDEARMVAAFFSTQRREGRWIVPERLTVTAVGGQVVLDLRAAILQGLHTKVQATVLGGQLHVLVPDGVRVVVASSRRPGWDGPAVGPRPRPGSSLAGPLIEIRAFTVAGRVRVQTVRRPGGWLGRFPRRPRGVRGPSGGRE
jgi:Domain of unknown function (DUF1707)